MRRVLVVEVRELKVVVYAAIDKMAHRRDRVCDFEDTDTGPQFVGFFDRKA